MLNCPFKVVVCVCVLETDMFYLAISMVGTDFSMIAQLLTHRNRAEIKVYSLSFLFITFRLNTFYTRYI